MPRRLAVVLLFAVALAAPAFAELPPLVPRSVFFSHPERAGLALSPDGRRLLYGARSPKGVMTLWIRHLESGDSTAVTTDDQPEARGHFWAPDGRGILCLMDRDGDENFHLYSIDPETRALRDLTPFDGVRAEMIAARPGRPEVLIGLNLRDRKVLDVHRLNLETGERRLATENPGDVIAWATDENLQVRGATVLDPEDASTVLRVRDAEDAPWRELVRWPFRQASNDRYQRILGFVSEGREILVQTPVRANTTCLAAIDLGTGKEREVFPADPRGDIWNLLGNGAETEVMVLRDPRTGAVQAVAINHEVPEWKAVDARVASDFKILEKIQRVPFTIESRDEADRLWVVKFHPDDGPKAYYLFDRQTKQARLLFYEKPQLLGVKLAKCQPKRIRARDGKSVPCYLTLPVGVPAKGLPLVLMIHGGPWWRDEWGYDPATQWLANRGYAVLQVNFRGSTGFGSQWLNAGDLQFGTGSVQHDITDAAQWAIAQGIADPKRIGITGASFGGYAVLCGLAFTPELYACGVDIVGPSDLATLFQSFPPYWAARKKRWVNRMGDVENDAALNRAISPLYHADRIRAPLLIGHGANDPRVKLAASEAIVKAIRDRQGEVGFVVYPDEGHGFAKEANNADFSSRLEAFLAKHLGGRAEPSETAVQGTSAQVR